MKDELGGKIMVKFVELIAKAYSYLIDGISQNKKAEGTKKCVMKRKLKLENDENYLEATQLEKRMNHLKKSRIGKDSLKKNDKEFTKKNQLILKAQQRFKSEKHNVFIEKIVKIALSSNNDKIKQSIHLTETYANGMSKDLLSEKEEIKCNKQ